MLDYRLKALEIFEKKPIPTWGGDVSKIDFQDIFYYVKPTSEEAKSWEDVPADMKRTFDKLGIPKPSRSSSPASAPSTTPRSCTTRSRSRSRSRA
jgi:Fe-S cluster assembly protein SufB